MADPAYDDDEDSHNTLFQRVLSLGLAPVRILTSRTAIKAYLSTLLFLGTSTVLLALSSAAYAFFYYHYIPQISLERVLYLQYGPDSAPHATAALDTNALVSQQAYNVELILDMPRTPTNLQAGNFMLDLSLLGSRGVPDAVASWLGNVTLENVLYHSRRPAILPYASPILSLSHTLLHLPWHLLNFRDLDRSRLVVPMFEMLVFPRGGGARNVPTHARLELQASRVLQVYDVKLAFRAKFQGLRYLIYNYRITAFVVFTALFYGVSVTSMALGWAVISHTLSSGRGGGERQKKRIKMEADMPIKTEQRDSSSGAATKVKTEEDEAESSGPHGGGGGGLSLSNISDTPTQFPTGRGRPPLSYAGRAPGSAAAEARVNVEAEDDHLRRPMGPGEAADDEDEGDFDGEQDIRGRRVEGDSGIGTSMESEHAAAGSGIVRRRSSRALGKG